MIAPSSNRREIGRETQGKNLLGIIRIISRAIAQLPEPIFAHGPKPAATEKKAMIFSSGNRANAVRENLRDVHIRERGAKPQLPVGIIAHDVKSAIRPRKRVW